MDGLFTEVREGLSEDILWAWKHMKPRDKQTKQHLNYFLQRQIPRMSVRGSAGAVWPFLSARVLFFRLTLASHSLYTAEAVISKIIEQDWHWALWQMNSCCAALLNDSVSWTLVRLTVNIVQCLHENQWVLIKSCSNKSLSLIICVRKFVLFPWLL